jgi:hypothetical protein
MTVEQQAPLRWFERQPSAETLDFHASYTAQLRAKHPELFTAPPPATLPPLTEQLAPNPNHPFGAIREQAAAGTYALRDPAASTAGLIPAASTGNCLSPVLQHGDVAWYDPHIEPQHGDVVAVLFTPEALEYIAEYHRLKYGTSVESIIPYAQKILWNERGQWLLLTNTGSIPLAAATVCGVCRRVERNSRVMYA